MKATSTKIFSWNVNGLRALVRKDGFAEMMQHEADIYCLQETKATKEQVAEEIANPDGFHSYFFPSDERKGHAGTVLYSREEPVEVTYGIGGTPKNFPQQGRTITALYKNKLAVINCYFPNGGSQTSNLEYKLEFYTYFLRYINKLRKQEYKVIIAADWNICHTEIDIARPEANKNNIGFLPIEREMITRFHDEGWIDVWRHANPKKVDVYTWWSFRSAARERNVGWRIDYLMTDKALLSNVSHVKILTDTMGSDHCPLVLEVKTK